ncbi:MAG: aldehyde dehydrogenase family protein, partial [Methanobacterium sp.]
MLINGEKIDKKEDINVKNPFNHQMIDTVPLGDGNDVIKAIYAANKAKKAMREMSS